MEYFGFEVHFGRHNGVLAGQTDLDQENMVSIWGVCWALNKSLPTQKVVLVEHEQEFVKLSFRSLDGFLHESLLIHILV